MASAPLTPFRVLWKRRALLEHQQRSVHRLRRFAAERSPFYRRYHKGLENRPLHELPILTKAALMEHFDDVVTDRSLRLADVAEHLKQDSGRGLFRGRRSEEHTSELQ